MKSQYISAFIIPIGASKNLTDVGWIFESENFVPVFALDYLLNNLKLNIDECYLVIKSFVGDDIQASAITNDKEQIESVYIKIYGDRLDFVVSEFDKSQLSTLAELFIPCETTDSLY